MVINWLYAQTVTGAIEFPQIWNSRGMLVSISDAAAPAWRIMGKLRIEASIGDGFYKSTTRTIEYGDSLIEIPYNAYRLSFLPSERTKTRSTIQIKIAPVDPVMLVSYPPAQLPALGKPIYSQPALPAGVDALSPFLLVPARARRAALIVNKTTASLYLCEGAPTIDQPLIAGDPFIAIPPGAQYSIGEWSGDIFGIFDTAPALGGKAIVKDLVFANAAAVTLPERAGIYPAPLPDPIAVAYGGVNLRADGVAIWTNKRGESVVDGTLAELFVFGDFAYGRAANTATYKSSGATPGWTWIEDSEYRTARSNAKLIIRLPNAPS